MLKMCKNVFVVCCIFLVLCTAGTLTLSAPKISNVPACATAVPLNETLPLEAILEAGQDLYGDAAASWRVDGAAFPCWFDPELARIGQKFATTYQTQISLGHLLSLIMLLGNQQVRQVMYATRRSDTPSKAFKRYTATGLHVGIWYKADILSPTWLKSVRTIRQIHRGVGANLKAMNKHGEFKKPLVTKETNPSGFYPDEKMWEAFNRDLEGSPYHPKNNLNLNSTAKNSKLGRQIHMPTHLFNQYLMSITQWSFVAMPLLFPSQLGIPKWTELELRGFYHLWAVISHVLGMKEEFILCRDPRDFHGCKAYLEGIYETHMIPSLFNIDFQGQILIEAILRSPKLLVPSAPVDFILIQLLEDIMGLRTPHLYALAGWQTRVGRFFGKHFAEPFFHWPAVQKISNFLLSGEIQLASKKTFGDAGTNLSAVAEQYYVFDR